MLTVLARKGEGWERKGGRGRVRRGVQPKQARVVHVHDTGGDISIHRPYPALHPPFTHKSRPGTGVPRCALSTAHGSNWGRGGVGGGRSEGADHTRKWGVEENAPPAHCAEATFTAQPPARVKGTQYRAVGAVCAHRGTHAPPAPPPGKRTRQPRRGHTVQRWRGSAASAGLRCVCTDRSNALFTEREGRGWNHCSFCCRS